MSEKSDFKAKYFSRTESGFPDTVNFLGNEYVKVEDLRYGTNPHQGASFYKPVNSSNLTFGDMEILKLGKSGLSETNYSDLNHGANIVKYFDVPACAVMKHLNPSGAAIQNSDSMSLKEVYIRARNADAVAAFGCTAVFNVKIDLDTAKEIMSSYVEVVAAPDFDTDAIAELHKGEEYKVNKEIRIVKLPNIPNLPKWVGENAAPTIKTLADGSIVVAEPLLTAVKGESNLVIGSCFRKANDMNYLINTQPTDQQIKDMLFSWYVNLSTRSNGVVIAKNGVTLAVGTGQQDRVAAVKQAIAKAKEKSTLNETIDGAVLSSDAFFPFRDSIDACAEVGIKAVIQPGGSMRDWDSIEACNENGITMIFTNERCFSHH